MTFKIDSFLNAATPDPALRETIIRVHDDLHTAWQIIESVKEATSSGGIISELTLIAVFNELRRTNDQTNTIA